MAALPNIGGASVQRRKVWLTLTTWLPCSNAAKTRKQLKLAGVPQTGKRISEPKFTILWGHVEDILLLNKFFPIVDTCLSCEDIARQSCGMLPRWRFLLLEIKKRKKSTRGTSQKWGDNWLSPKTRISVESLLLFRSYWYLHSDGGPQWPLHINKNSSGDEIANVNFYAVRPEATRIRWNNAK